jgi:hypothetical protein
MNALSQLVLGDDTFTVDPLHLSITQRFKTGATSNLHLLEDGDLGVKGLFLPAVGAVSDTT